MRHAQILNLNVHNKDETQFFELTTYNAPRLLVPVNCEKVLSYDALQLYLPLPVDPIHHSDCHDGVVDKYRRLWDLTQKD